MTFLHRALWAASALSLVALALVGWQAATYITDGHGLHPALAGGLGLWILGLGWACATLADTIAARHHVE
jgi:hypothetical protein